MKDILNKLISFRLYLCTVKYDYDEDIVSATNDTILLVIGFIRLQAQKQVVADVHYNHITIGEAYKFYLEHRPIREHVLHSLDIIRARITESDSDVTTDSERSVIMEQHFVVSGSETLFRTRKNCIRTPWCILLLRRKAMIATLCI